MHHSPAPFTTYLDLYQKYPKDVLSRKARQLEWDIKDDTVLTTWEISFSAVQKKMPEAATILLISGNLAPEGIPQIFFTCGGFLSGMSNSSTWGSRPLMTFSLELQVQQAFGILLSFSFIQRSVGASDVSVHPLIHLWARLRLSLSEQKTLKETSLIMLDEYVGRSKDANNNRRHISHFWSIYTSIEPCDTPSDIDLPAICYDAANSNVFNIYPYTKTVHTVFSCITAIKQLIFPFHFNLQRLPTTEFHRIRRGILLWEFLGSRLFDSRIGGYKKFEDVPSWQFCQASKLFLTEDSTVITALFLPAEGTFYNGKGDIDLRFYGWLLIWYGQARVHQHPVVAGLQLGLGFILGVCYSEMRGLRSAYYSSGRERSTWKPSMTPTTR